MRKKKRRLSVFIMVILILTVGMAGIRTAEGYAAWQQDSAGIAQGIATEIIRFHVRANSDSEADQQLKLQVKDRVVTYMEPLLRESQDIEQSRQILEEQTENIRTLALDTLREAGSDYDVAVYYDAWENDNDTDPIVSLVYEIAKQLGMTYTFDPDTDFLNWAVQF